MAEKKNTNAKYEHVNSLTDVVGTLTGFGGQGFQGVPLNRTDTLQVNTSYSLVFWNRTLLSQLYIKHGIVQTLIDQPVDDAFRGGIEVTTGELSTEELECLMDCVEEQNIVEKVGQAIKWKRLFGGGALVIMTDQKQDTPLDVSKITEDNELILYPADLWELNGAGNKDDVQEQIQFGPDDEQPYLFYGHRLHPSRVLTLKGREAPSIFRQRFRGWGMSEVERLIRSLNQFFKNQDVLFELMDEAKVDVIKVEKLNQALMKKEGTDAVIKRIQMANMLKNFNSALVMDKNDEYDQKQMNLSGIADVMKTIREGVAADLKMPVTKLFGVSSAGFNSGEDDIENYNSMIESEIRSKSKWVFIKVLQILCNQKFGKVPDDLRIKYPSLRLLPANEEEQVKSQQFNRALMAYQNGIIDAKQFQAMANKANLLPTEIEETDEPFDIMGDQMGAEGLLDLGGGNENS